MWAPGGAAGSPEPCTAPRGVLSRGRAGVSLWDRRKQTWGRRHSRSCWDPALLCSVRTEGLGPGGPSGLWSNLPRWSSDPQTSPRTSPGLAHGGASMRIVARQDPEQWRGSDPTIAEGTRQPVCCSGPRGGECVCPTEQEGRWATPDPQGHAGPGHCLQGVFWSPGQRLCKVVRVAQ